MAEVSPFQVGVVEARRHLVILESPADKIFVQAVHGNQIAATVGNRLVADRVGEAGLASDLAATAVGLMFELIVRHPGMFALHLLQHAHPAPADPPQ